MANKKRGPAPGSTEVSLRNNPKRQQVFLEVLRTTGNFRQAANAASPHTPGECVATFRGFQRDCPEFAAKIHEAVEEFKESLIQAAVQRGRDGVPRPIYQKGQLVGHEQVYSDNLLLAELRKHFPAEYAQKYDVNHNLRVNPIGAWTISQEDLAALTEEEREQLRAIMDSIRAHRHKVLDRKSIV